MTDLSIPEQRARAGVDGKGRVTRRGRPTSQEGVRVDGVEYPTVGGEERVDLPEQDIDDRRDRFDEQRRAFAAARRANRERKDLWDRLRAVGDQMAEFQALRARAIAPAGRDESRDRAVLPPGGDEHELAHVDPVEVRRRFTHIERTIERLEEMVDAHMGLAPARDYAVMSSHEKNAVILTEFVGWRPEEVAAFEPALGTARTIRYVRTDWADDPRNHWPGGSVRGVCGHAEGHCTVACPKQRGPQARREAA